MLDEVLLVKCLKVALDGLRFDWLHRLSLNLRSCDEFETLISILIGSLRFKRHRFVGLESNNISSLGANLTDSRQHLVVLFQFLRLLLGETLSVRRLAFEGKGVEWILRLLFVENILVTILPVWECFLVT